MKKRLTCRHPDRDCPKLMCGYPLPCPYHTATIDMTTRPPSLIIPITADAAFQARSRLAEIAEAIRNGVKP